MKVYINEKEIKGKQYAYDGCHKIYVIESEQDLAEATDNGYTIHPIETIKDCYENSCQLKFISNWQLDTQYVEQYPDTDPEFVIISDNIINNIKEEI